MNKPKPKKELAIVQRVDYKDQSFLTIHTTTPDAANWTSENLSEFGFLDDWGGGRFHLSIRSELYDVDEVVAYIESMGV